MVDDSQLYARKQRRNSFERPSRCSPTAAYDPATHVPIDFYSHIPLGTPKREKPTSWAKTHRLMGDIETYF